MRKLTDQLLSPERIAWRALMSSISEANDVKHNESHVSGHTRRSYDLDAEIQSYEEDVALLQVLIQTKRNLAAALRRRPLPCEIWSHIFLECRRSDPSAPATVSRVCHEWRQVALGHRMLWDRIELTGRETGLDRASLWADRSDPSSLDLVVRCSGAADRKDMVPWLQERASRIKSLSIVHMHRGAGNRLLPSLPPFDHMHALRILGLEDLDFDMKWIARLLEGSPRLQSLSLSGVCALHNPMSLIGVASQLTHLSFGALSHIDYDFPLQADVVLEVISTCTGLQSLECHNLSDQGEEPPTAFLPCLSSLSIGDGEETCIILKHLRAPQLRFFRLTRGRILNEHEVDVGMPVATNHPIEYAEFFVECLQELHEMCSPRITRVMWDHTVVNIGILKYCAPYLPAMEELECRGLSKSSDLVSWSFLSRDFEGYIGLYPWLRSIKLTKCALGPSGLASIMAAISLRKPPFSAEITQLTVEDCQGVDDMYMLHRWQQEELVGLSRQG